MTELFEPTKAEQRREDAEKQEEEAVPNFVVQVFFFLAIAGGLSLLAHWMMPNQGSIQVLRYPGRRLLLHVALQPLPKSRLIPARCYPLSVILFPIADI